MKESDFLSIVLIKTQALSSQCCSRSEQFPGIITGFSKMLPGLSWMEVLGFRESSLPSPVPGCPAAPHGSACW